MSVNTFKHSLHFVCCRHRHGDSEQVAEPLQYRR